MLQLSAGCSDGTSRRTRESSSVRLHEQSRAGRWRWRCVGGRSVIRKFTPTCTTCFLKNGPLEKEEKNCYLDCYLQSVNGCCYFKTARQKWGPVKKKNELWQLRGWERQTGEGVRYNRTCWRRRRRRKKKSKRGNVSKGKQR